VWNISQSNISVPSLPVSIYHLKLFVVCSFVIYPHGDRLTQPLVRQKNPYQRENLWYTIIYASELRRQLKIGWTLTYLFYPVFKWTKPSLHDNLFKFLFRTTLLICMHYDLLYLFEWYKFLCQLEPCIQRHFLRRSMYTELLYLLATDPRT
jgi:hypothetical protein